MLSVIVVVPSLLIAPPNNVPAPPFPSKVEASTVSAPPEATNTAPPKVPPPPVTVSELRFNVPLPVTKKICAPLPSRVMSALSSAPVTSPSMVRVELMVITPSVSSTVPPDRPLSKTIVSPEFAVVIASRSVRSAGAAVLSSSSVVTVSVAIA